MRSYLITGNKGFIAANYLESFINRNDHFVGLDYMSNASNPSNSMFEGTHNNYKFIKGNINNTELLNYIFDEYQINTVINFAAESFVDYSIDNPTYFAENNAIGTNKLVDVAAKQWKNKTNKLFIQISTDEVYLQRGLESTYESKETDLTAPRNPYAASKLSSENIVQSYIHTYNFPAIITRSCNNFGPKQCKEKFIPTIIDCLINDRPIPIYGDGLNVRDWIYVKDNCDAINYIIRYGKIGEIYNIGADNLIDNITIVNTIIDIYKLLTGNDKSNLISFVKDRPGHDRKYCISSDKLKDLGWQSPQKDTFYGYLKDTVEWYIKKGKQYTYGVNYAKC